MIKYPKLINHYKKADINKWVRNFPDLLEQVCLVTEKLDGANFGIEITQSNVRYFSRNRELLAGDDFFEYQSVVKQDDIVFLIDQIQDQIQLSETDTVLLHGELYGQGIQNRIEYGPKNIKLFDMWIDGELQPKIALINLLEVLDLADLFVPVYKQVGFHKLPQMIEEAEEQDNIEGFVFSPLNKVYNNQYSVLQVKIKTKKFADKSAKKHKSRQSEDLTPIQQELRAEFESYINENRVLDFYSKEGVIKEFDRIGFYIKNIVADAKDDFLEDNKHRLAILGNKYIYRNAGKLVRDYLLKELRCG